MDLKDIFIKLDNMNEHISVLRENTARLGAVLEENTRDVRTHIRRTELLETKVETIEKQQDQWKGAAIVISALIGVVASYIARYVLK